MEWKCENECLEAKGAVTPSSPDKSNDTFWNQGGKKKKKKIDEDAQLPVMDLEVS